MNYTPLAVNIERNFIVHHKPYLTQIGGYMESDIYFLYTMDPRSVLWIISFNNFQF